MTAVEFLIEFLDLYKYQNNKEKQEIIEQALTIEKHQITEAWTNSRTKVDCNSAEEYYNKTTFKQ
jgi:hypothetical protein